MLNTITRAPEEFTLHETRMYQSYGVDYVRGDAWQEVDACLTTLAMKAVEQGHELRVAITTRLFTNAHSEQKLQSRLSLFAEIGTLAISRTPPTFSHAKGPF